MTPKSYPRFVGRKSNRCEFYPLFSRTLLSDAVNIYIDATVEIITDDLVRFFRSPEIARLQGDLSPADYRRMEAIAAQNPHLQAPTQYEESSD